MTLSACASVDVTGFVVPGETLDPAGDYYVVFSDTDRQALSKLVQAGLLQYRLNTTGGVEDEMPANTDYLIEYDGQWQWDITWYLLNLSIRIYEPDTKLLVATASSLRTSLARRSPEEMVAEALHVLFVE